jgi:hypothetical protein
MTIYRYRARMGDGYEIEMTADGVGADLVRGSEDAPDPIDSVTRGPPWPWWRCGSKRPRCV